MDKLNRWLTLGANLGVMASLIFVAYQIRQNTAQMHVEASYSINQSLSALNSAIYGDNELAALYLKGCESYVELSDLEKAQFRAYALNMINLFIFANKLEEQDLGGIHTNISTVMIERFQNNPGLREFLISFHDEWAAGDELYQMLLGE